MRMLPFLTSLISAARQAGVERRRDGKKRIWMIGPMPLPLNGQSNYNQTILAFFRKHAPVALLPTGGRGGEKLVASIVLPFIILFSIRAGDHVYTSPPGQKGIWLFMASILALRVRKLDHFVHHHSFRPINLGPTRSARMLTSLGGNYQRHIFLSEKMMQRYADLYLSERQRQRSFVLPNAYLFSREDAVAGPRSGPITIGHLSVITREKGVGYLMELIERLIARRSDFVFVLAGPIRDPGLNAEVKAFCVRHPTVVSYLGPVFDEAKSRFYRQLDMFVLPSRLIDEADPLVILEAFGHGCDVIASPTGCIPERVLSPERLMTFDIETDVASFEKRISEMRRDRDKMPAACVAHARKMHAEAIGDAERFFGALDITLAKPNMEPTHGRELAATR